LGTHSDTSHNQKQGNERAAVAKPPWEHSDAASESVFGRKAIHGELDAVTLVGDDGLLLEICVGFQGEGHQFSGVTECDQAKKAALVSVSLSSMKEILNLS
jgi:hypothetical protein